MPGLDVTIWNVAHGSAAFLSTPNGRSVLLDAGASDDFSPARHLREQYRLYQSDCLIISHPDEDHITDLPNLVALVPPRVFHRNPTIPAELIYPPTGISGAKQTYYELDHGYNAPIPADYEFYPSNNWAGVSVSTFFNTPAHLETPTTNNLSLLTVISYSGLTIVFPGDLEPPGWRPLLNRPEVRQALATGSTRILVAPHHGRGSGIMEGSDVYEDFLALFAPHLVVMSDVYGSEHTRPDLYRSRALGLAVFSRAARQYQQASVVTTKTNNFVRVSHDGRAVAVTLP